jgi:hypothetical protein
VLAIVEDSGPALALLWLFAIALIMLTSAICKARYDERLLLAGGYRSAAAVTCAVSLAGALLALVPNASVWTNVFAPYFALAAGLAYRAVVARGPRAALQHLVVAVIAWPLFMLPLVGCCRRVPEQPPWTELATWSLLRATVLLSALTATVALIAFRERRDGELPQARLA